MNNYPNTPETPDEESAPKWLVQALKELPSETAHPSPEADEAIMRMAHDRLNPSPRISRRTHLWPTLAVAACIALGVFAFSLWEPSTPGTGPTLATEDDAALILREIALLFPGHVRFIVRDETGLQVELMDEPSAAQGQPVVLEVCERGDCMEIITYIGQTVEIQGRSVTIQSDSDGQILIEGAGISWSSGHPTQPLPNLNIRTRVI